MTMRTLLYDGFSVRVDSGWDDNTNLFEGETTPLTLTNEETGVGAIQISTAMYRRGRLPEIRNDDLTEMLDDFAASKNLQDRFDRKIYACDIPLVGESYKLDENFVRVWYASDGMSILLITYVSSWEARECEADSREMSVQSIRFDRSGESSNAPSI